MPPIRRRKKNNKESRRYTGLCEIEEEVSVCMYSAEERRSQAAEVSRPPSLREERRRVSLEMVGAFARRKKKDPHVSFFLHCQLALDQRERRQR